MNFNNLLFTCFFLIGLSSKAQIEYSTSIEKQTDDYCIIAIHFNAKEPLNEIEFNFENPQIAQNLNVPYSIEIVDGDFARKAGRKTVWNNTQLGKVFIKAEVKSEFIKGFINGLIKISNNKTTDYVALNIAYTKTNVVAQPIEYAKVEITNGVFNSKNIHEKIWIKTNGLKGFTKFSQTFNCPIDAKIIVNESANFTVIENTIKLIWVDFKEQKNPIEIEIEPKELKNPLIANSMLYFISDNEKKCYWLSNTVLSTPQASETLPVSEIQLPSNVQIKLPNKINGNESFDVEIHVKDLKVEKYGKLEFSASNIEYAECNTSESFQKSGDMYKVLWSNYPKDDEVTLNIKMKLKQQVEVFKLIGTFKYIEGNVKKEVSFESSAALVIADKNLTNTANKSLKIYRLLLQTCDSQSKLNNYSTYTKTEIIWKNNKFYQYSRPFSSKSETEKVSLILQQNGITNTVEEFEYN